MRTTQKKKVLNKLKMWNDCQRSVNENKQFGYREQKKCHQKVATIGDHMEKKKQNVLTKKRNDCTVFFFFLAYVRIRN